ncbi:hypothetical protein D3C79_334170 [compost metagenome]
MSSGVLQFLSPSLGNPLEIVFFSVIMGGMLISLITAEVFGRAPAWERNWQGGTHKGALDIEHGSIGELGQAVATLPERMVGNMPGLLLIVGLLGTFLGLGMALDKASAILQGSADSLNAMSDSLGQLTGMMKDLGTKFKTSTWGIIAFIVLKLWDSARWSAESRRTGWCVDRMKREIDQSRLAQKNLDDARNLAARETLQAVGEQLVQAFVTQSQLLGNELKQVKIIEFKRGQKQDEQFGQLAAHLGKHLQQLQQLTAPAGHLATLASYSAHLPRLDLLERHGESLQNIDAGLGRLQEQTTGHAQTLLDAIDQRHQESLDARRVQHDALLVQARQDAELADRHAQHQLSALAEQHQAHLDAQRVQHDALLDQARQDAELADRHAQTQLAALAEQHQALQDAQKTLNQDLLSQARQEADLADGRAHNLLSALAEAHQQQLAAQRAQGDELHEQLKTLATLTADGNQLIEVVGQHTLASQQSLDQFVGSSTDNLKALEQAGTTMGQAAEHLATSAKALETSVEVMEKNVSGAIDTLNDDFQGHLHNMQASLDGNIVQLRDVMNQLQSGLMENVNQMSQDFSRNTTAMSENLKGATDNISQAVEGLTGEVNDVMAKVSENIEAANATQRKVGAMIVSTNDGLNATIDQMTKQMAMIAGQVSEGLRDVSENSKRMDRVGKQLVKFPELAESLDKLHEHFQALLQQGALTTQVLEKLPSELRADLSQNGRLLSKAVSNLEQLSQQLNTLTLCTADKVGEQFSNHLQPLHRAADSTVALLKRMADQAQPAQARQPSDESLTA